MYNNISKKIFNCPRRKATSFNTEDFNPKVDIYTEGNKPTVIKGGRQLTKMAKKYDLLIINNKNRVCKRDYGPECKAKKDQY